MTSLVAKTTMSSGRERVYVSAVPLRGSKGPAQILMSTVYSLNLWDFQHFMVIVEPSSTSSDFKALVYDFQPQDPESVYVALEALSGKSISGVVRMRKLSKLPKKKCWFVGSSNVESATETASKFNQNWDTNLRIGHHDCRDYTDRLIESLTGEKNVLDHLRRINGASKFFIF